MNHFRNLALLCLWALIPGYLLAQTNYSVSNTTITFRDAERGNRRIQTKIYYPSAASGTNTPIAQGEFPVIVFGHGFVMGYGVYNHFWEELVPQGYIMAFPTTEGSFFANHENFYKDLAFLAEAIQAENEKSNSIFYQAVDEKTALMGHSMGGGAPLQTIRLSKPQ